MTREEFLKTFPKYVPNYKPSAASQEYIKNVSLLIVVGPSGSGKTSIINELDCQYVPTDVTRPARPEEKDGVDMYFLEDYDGIIADIQGGKFLQFVAGASGDFYGTRASSFPSSGWAVMPVIADAVPTFRRLGFKNTTTVFIAPPSYKEWMRRLEGHHLSEEQQHRRLKEAVRSLDFALNDNHVNFILNDDLPKAVEQVKNILIGIIDDEREAKALHIAQALLENVGYNMNLPK